MKTGSSPTKTVSFSIGQRGLLRSRISKSIGIRAAAAAAAILLQIYTIKILGPEVFGKYVVFITTCSLLTVFAKAGLDTVAVRTMAIAIRRERIGIAYATLIRISIAIVFGSILMMPVASFLPTVSAADIRFEPVLTCSAVLAMCLASVSVAAVRGAGHQVVADTIDALLKPAILAFGVAAIAWAGVSVFSLIASAYIFAHLVVVFVSIAYIYDKYGVRFEAATLGQSTSVSELIALTASGVLSFAFFQADTLLVAASLGSEEAGAYAAACNYVRIVLFLPLILSAAVQPKLAVAFNEGNVGLARALLVRYATFSVSSSVLGVLVLLFGGEEILALTGPGFARAYWAMIVLSVAHVANGLILICSAALFMARKAQWVMASQLAGALVCLPVELALVDRFGTVGAAAGVLAGLSVNMCVVLIGVLAVMKESLGGDR